MDKTNKFGFAGLNLELTRGCNLCCPHCSRGDAQNLTISEKTIDTMLSQTLSITDLLITGGEPLLELDKLEYLVNSIDRYDVPIFRIGIVTNGTILDERVALILKRFLMRNPSSYVNLEVSNDAFHDRLQSSKCAEFYSQFADERFRICFHEDFDFLINSGRSFGKKSVNGIPVMGVSDNAIRQHRLKISENNISCRMHISANGNFGFAGDISFKTSDDLALGNVLVDSLSDIIKKNQRECPYLCDECYKEAVLQNYEDFRTKSTTIQDDMSLLRFKIIRKHLEFIWKLRRWAFQKFPEINPMAIIAGTIIGDSEFLDYCEKYVILKYQIVKRLRSTKEAEDYFMIVACTEHEKSLKKRFPDATNDEIYQLSRYKVLYGAINLMTLDDFKLALFQGNPAEKYFATIEERLKKHGVNINEFDACSKLPDTLDVDEDDWDEFKKKL